MDKIALTSRRHASPAGLAQFSTTGRAFTIVELLVVIAIIGLVLSIAIPNVSSMQKQMDRTNAIQAIDSALTRAKYSASSTGDYIALRFMPSLWSGPVDPNADLLSADRGRMQIVTYEWKAASWVDNINEVAFVERFEPREETSIVRLPLNTWVAPSEAAVDPNKVSGNARDVAYEIIDGEPGVFEFEAGHGPGNGTGKKNGDFLQMDDFLIVFDQEGNVVPGPRESVSTLYEGRPGKPQHQPYPLLGAYDPKWDNPNSSKNAVETDRDGSERFTRFNFSGIAIYDRDSYLSRFSGKPGSTNDKKERVRYLAQNAQPQMVHPRSARLKEIAQ